MREQITRALHSLDEQCAFCCRHTAGCENLRLEVNGVGEIRLPISGRQARELRKVARPARFGIRDRTVLDREVRDTWEIARSRVKFDQRRWRQTLDPQLESIRCELGLPEDTRLEARFHKLLVYEPGQFFRAHQDSEKGEDMIGTLSAVLPSSYRGGTEVIEHRGEKVNYRRTRGSGRTLTFIAFYADCHHEIKPITDGYRIVLVYDLLARKLPTDQRADHRAPGDVAEVNALAAALARYFAAPTSEHAHAPPVFAEKLIYLLDHDYTQSSLSWHRLKGVDATRVAALRAVAEHEDYEIHLALADIHESWDCADDSPSWDYRGHAYYRDEDEDEDDEDSDDADGDLAEHLELIELLESEVQIRHLIEPSGKKSGISSLDVFDSELCHTKATDELEPFRMEHEPFMGNYGNTVDRWYHRAAVVLWPRGRAFAIRSKGDPSWAMMELARRLKNSGVQDAREAARSLRPFWPRAVHQAKGKRLLGRTMKVASALGDRELAAALLEPFTLEDFVASSVPSLAPLLDGYGVEWFQQVCVKWDPDTRWYGADHRRAWFEHLPELCIALRGQESAAMTRLAQWLLAREWDCARAAASGALTDPHHPRVREVLSVIAAWMMYVVEGCTHAGNARVHDDIMAFILADHTSLPAEALIAALRGCRARLAPKQLRTLALGEVHECAVSTLSAALSKPGRSVDDWSIEPPMTCTCALCKTLGRFLAAPDQRRLDWPLASEGRRHVHEQIDGYDLPVSHSTRRSGRPYTLMLAKQDALFARELQRRMQRERDLKWLHRQRASFV